MPQNGSRANQDRLRCHVSTADRPPQISLPATNSAEFAAQVAHDIAAVAQLSAEDAAMLDAFERIAAEDCGA